MTPSSSPGPLRRMFGPYQGSVGGVVLAAIAFPVVSVLLVVTTLSYALLVRAEQHSVVEHLSSHGRTPVRVLEMRGPLREVAEGLVRPEVEPLRGARTVVVRRTDGTLLAGEDPVPAEVWRAVAATDGGVVRVGGMWVTARPVQRSDWALVTMYPARLVQARALATATGLLAAAGVGVLVALVAVYVASRRLVSRRIQQLAVTTGQLAGGNLAVRAAEDGDDELGALAAAFNGVAERLDAHKQAQARQALEFERLVEARTAQLAAQTRDLRRMLDTARQGFVTIDLSGRMSPNRSRIIERWLGACETHLLHEYLSSVDPVAAEWLEIGLQAVAEDEVLRDLSLAQLPRRLRTQTGVVDLEYIPIEEGGQLVNLLVVLTDVTGQIERERIEREQQEVVAIFQWISGNPWSFSDFFDESKQMIELLEAHPPTPIALRIIHTLKGNCATFGITSMELVCHEVEEEAKHDGLTTPLVQRVVAAWHAVQARVRTLLPEKRTATISVSEVEYRALVERIREVAPASDLLDTLDAWQLEPVRDRLDTLAEHARRLADRLGKGPLVVDVDAHDVRLEPTRWSSLWAALQHAVRNAIDHGLESEPDRILAGKPSTGRLRLLTTVEGGEVVISVQDDGRGIDWQKVAERARAMGVPHGTPAELQEALFVDGLSTRDVVTTISGRGVGMSALLAEVRARAGHLAITTEVGVGTRLDIHVPLVSRDQAFRWSSAA